MGLELTLVVLIFLGYSRTFWTSRSKRGSRQPGKCLITLSSSVLPCTHKCFISFSVSSPPLIPFPSFSLLASSSMVRDVKDLARVLGGMRKDNVRPLESKKGLWINQGECRYSLGWISKGKGEKKGKVGSGTGPDVTGGVGLDW